MTRAPVRILIGVSAALALSAGGTAVAMPKPSGHPPRPPGIVSRNAPALAGARGAGAATAMPRPPIPLPPTAGLPTSTVRDDPRAGSVGGRVPMRPAASAWKIVKSPNPLIPNGMITAVSCTAASACEAVGSSYNGSNAYVPLAEAWDGTAWKLQATPRPSNASDSSELLGVSCAAASACEAVGDYITRSGATVTLAEAWNGTAWKVQPTPNPGGAEAGPTLFGISCSAADRCEAVGYFFSAGDYFPFAEAWNGTAWKLQSTPNPAGATNTALSGVSCTAANACEAVGGASSGPLAEAWDGTAWKLQSTPNPGGAANSELYGVSCSAASTCEAVGSYTDGARKKVTLAQAWDGTAWKLQPSPDPAGAITSDLYGVSCPAAKACEADGYYLDRIGDYVALAQAWNGTAWKLQPTPDQMPRATKNSLNAVSCGVAGSCEAVGNYRNSLGSSLALAEAWNGTAWKLQPTPIPPGVAGDVVLAGVSCRTAVACEAVGYFFGIPSYLQFAEAWNGTAWKLQPTPNPGGSRFTSLGGVSCRASDACQAVGGSPSGTLAEGWNGTAWKLQATPNPAGATGSGLSGVSCTAATACEAVGNYTIGRRQLTLVMARR